MIRTLALVALAASVALPAAARADAPAETAADVLARLVPGRLVDEATSGAFELPSLDAPLRLGVSEEKPNAMLWGLLCPGGGQFANGDWFAGLGVLGAVGILGGTGATLLALDGDIGAGPALGLSVIGLGVVFWVLAAIEASVGGACLGNCLGGCLAACGVAALLPDGGSRRPVIRDGEGGSRPGPRPAPRPETARPAPARPAPTPQ